LTLKDGATEGGCGIGDFWWEPAVFGPLRSRGYFGDDGNALPVISVFNRFTRK
jgi:arabinogalactan endo-1,4-beta-galactosidase